MPVDKRTMVEKSTFGLTPAQLGRLLAVSAKTIESADAIVEDQVNQRLLQEHLSRRLSGEPSFEKTLLSEGGRTAGEVRPLLNRSVKEALLDPHGDLAVLRAIKDHSKRLSAMVTSGSETLMTTTIYHAAIAAAMVHHNQRISQYSCESLAERFSLLAQRLWMDQELKGLFSRAVEICRQAKTDAL